MLYEKNRYLDDSINYGKIVTDLISITSRTWEIFESSKIDRKRQILGMLTSNFEVGDKNLYVVMKSPFNLIYELNKTKEWGLSSDIARKKTNEYLEYVGMIEHKNKKVSQLSSGMQQKVQLGTALIHNPEILILDEPFKGLDPVNRQLFIDIFVERAKKGTTILYSTHVIDEAQKMADSLLIIKDGKRLEYGRVNDVRKKYGSDNIIIEFDGKVPDKETKLYSSVITNKRIEITPNKSIKTEEILTQIIKNGTKILRMELDYPSLNQIFINLMKD